MRVRYNSRLETAFNLYLKVRKDRPGNDPVGKAVRNKNGLPAIRILKAYTVGLEIPEILRTILYYTNELNIVPIDDMQGNLYGFFYRGIDKKHTRVESHYPALFYGLHNFSGFKYGMPIILAEGIKDVEAFIQNGYSYCLAIMSNRLSGLQIDFLKTLTNSIVWIGDNDYYGKLHAFKQRKLHSCISLYFPPEKDTGIIFDKDSPNTLNFIKAIVKLVGGNV